MAKAKIIHFYILCILICSSAISQSNVTPSKEGVSTSNARDKQLASPREQRDCLRELYLSQVGVREVGDNNRGPEVKTYLNSVGLDEGYPWCAAFVSWCHQQVEIEAPISAWVPSFALRDKMVYKQGKILKRLPKYGDVLMIWFKRLGRPAHIGFVDQWGDKWVISVEGNTNEDGSREGDGIYRKRRLKRQIWAVSNFINDESE